MIAKVSAFTLQGLDALPLEVEAGVYNGLPDLTVVGLPDAVLRESRERVRSAVVNAGYLWPARRMLVNLAPAHIRKEGSGLDLAVAVSLLKASGQLPNLDTDRLVFAGELSLDGSLRGTRGILAAALSMDMWPDRALAVPAANRDEAARGTGRVLALESLAQLRDTGAMEQMIQGALAGKQHVGEIPMDKPLSMGQGGNDAITSHGAELVWNLSSVKGQHKAKRALEIAAAGGHHLLFLGPPGSGKSLMARCLQGLLPPMSDEEMLEVNRVYSAAGLLGPETPWMYQRPFRSPHAGVTKAGLLGGGTPFHPGEASLSHCGVLYIDEIPEMSRNCLESLRQPLEDGQITISRVWGSVTVPAKIQLVASANPCPCGYYGEYPPRCKCLDHEVRRYQNRFSGPLLDRMDMVAHVPRLDAENLGEASADAEDSRAVAARVAQVRQKRVREERGARQDIESLRLYLTAQSEAWALTAYETHRLTARGYCRMLTVAKTIADLGGEDRISTASLAEALAYRLAAY